MKHGKEYWKKWFAAAGIRAIKTWAQTFVSVASVGGIAPTINGIPWILALSSATGAAVISFACSLAGLPEIEVPEEAGDK